MKRLVLALALAGATIAAFALPSLDEVQAEVGKGNYLHAQEMMREVVAAKPGSARAHYVYAEILAHDRRFDQAAEQAARARAIDPTLQFAQPDRFRAFEQLLQREQAGAARAATGDHDPAAAGLRQLPETGRGSGIPGWVWGLGLAAAAALLWRGFGRSRAAAPSGSYAMAPAAAGAMPASAAAGGYGPSYPSAPAAGSGLLGTGLAVAGGVAAGMLAEKLLDGHRGADYGSTAAPGLRGLAPGLLGEAPGDDAAQRELEQRPVDFGNGDGWGGGDAGGGDGGSSGGDGGW